MKWHDKMPWKAAINGRWVEKISVKPSLEIVKNMFTMQFLTSSLRFIQSNFDTLSLPECASEFHNDAPSRIIFTILLMSHSWKQKCSTYLIKTSHEVQKWNCENTCNWNCHESHLDGLWMISPRKANSIYLKINNKLVTGLCTLSCCLGGRIVAYSKKWFMELVKMAIFLLYKKIYGHLNQ